MSTTLDTALTQIENEAFEAFVAKGIHAILYRVHRVAGAIKIDKSKNILYRCPIGNINGSGDTVDSEEFQDQLRGGVFKTKIGGTIDAGNLTFDTYFDPNRGRPDIVGVVNSMVFTPQFVLALARQISETELEGFFLAGVNYGGGMDIKGTLGKTVGSSLKFEITGEPKIGYGVVGTFPMTDYTAGATGGEIASADPFHVLLDSTTPVELTA